MSATVLRPARFVSTLSVVIEKGIPMPKPGHHTVWRFGEMKVADSFLVPEGRESGARSAAGMAGRRSNKQFACRTVIVDRCKRLRIWRMK